MQAPDVLSDAQCICFVISCRSCCALDCASACDTGHSASLVLARTAQGGVQCLHGCVVQQTQGCMILYPTILILVLARV
jgi:hypothetical protein